jgi:hypothetical protein
MATLVEFSLQASPVLVPLIKKRQLVSIYITIHYSLYYVYICIVKCRGDYRRGLDW